MCRRSVGFAQDGRDRHSAALAHAWGAKNQDAGALAVVGQTHNAAAPESTTHRANWPAGRSEKALPPNCPHGGPGVTARSWGWLANVSAPPTHHPDER